MHIVLILSFILAIYALGVWLFQIVWNLVMPAVFGLPVISFWLAAGIVFLLGFIGSVIRK